MTDRPDNAASRADPIGALARTAPESLTDSQLIDACCLVGWERRMFEFGWSGWGCGASLLVAGIANVACAVALSHFVSAPAHWLQLAVALSPFGLMLAGVLFFSIGKIPGRRRERYWKELQRRYAGAEVREYVGQLELESSRTDGGPELAVIVSGAALPHGGEWLVIVRLFADQTGAVEMRKLGFRHSLRADARGANPEKGKTMLSPADCMRVREMVAALQRVNVKSHLTSTVYDGAPATLAAWERGRGVVNTARCNLAGVPSKADANPAVRLMRLTLELGQKPPTTPLMVGSCGFSDGSIRIDGM